MPLVLTARTSARVSYWPWSASPRTGRAEPASRARDLDAHLDELPRVVPADELGPGDPDGLGPQPGLEQLGEGVGPGHRVVVEDPDPARRGVRRHGQRLDAALDGTADRHAGVEADDLDGLDRPSNAGVGVGDGVRRVAARDVDDDEPRRRQRLGGEAVETLRQPRGSVVHDDDRLDGRVRPLPRGGRGGQRRGRRTPRGGGGAQVFGKLFGHSGYLHPDTCEGPGSNLTIRPRASSACGAPARTARPRCRSARRWHRAYSRHSTRTSQPTQTFLASRVEPPFSGKNASGSVWAHSDALLPGAHASSLARVRRNHHQIVHDPSSTLTALCVSTVAPSEPALRRFRTITSIRSRTTSPTDHNNGITCVSYRLTSSPRVIFAGSSAGPHPRDRPGTAC